MTADACSILLADDDSDDLFLVQRLLARAGIRHPVVCVRNGDEVVSLLRLALTGRKEQVLPGLVFLDIKMPKLDGFEVLRWIRRQNALKELPVVILSGSDEPRDRARAAELGATDYIVKHPRPEAFARIVAEHIARG